MAGKPRFERKSYDKNSKQLDGKRKQKIVPKKSSHCEDCIDLPFFFVRSALVRYAWIIIFNVHTYYKLNYFWKIYISINIYSNYTTPYYTKYTKNLLNLLKLLFTRITYY